MEIETLAPIVERLAPWAFGLFFVAYALYQLRDVLRGRKEHLRAEAEADKAEATFKSMFPELQPHFHPERVDEYVFARLDREEPEEGRPAFSGSRKLLDQKSAWKDPPGFPAAESATLESADGWERTVLLDAAGKPLAEFLFAERPEGGGILRIGEGELTATRDAKDRPSVRYRHPEREFEWKWPRDWKFMSRGAEARK